LSNRNKDRAVTECLSRHARLFIWVIGAALAFVPIKAQAQLKSNAAAVNLNATLNSSISITAAPGLVNFNLVPNGTVTGSSPITIKTNWALPILFGNLNEYAYFTAAPSALSDGAGDNIPSSSVSGSVNGGAFTAFTGASPFAAGSSVTIFNQTIFIFFTNPGNRTDTLNLQINTTGLGLPAGLYTGVLHIEAQAL
jgi:hypothetical protein